LLPIKDLSALLHDLQNKLKTQPHGVGDVLITLLGRDKAEEVATKENVVLRMIELSKRPLEHDDASDDRLSKICHLSDSD
jgi:hypothetical protein